MLSVKIVTIHPTSDLIRNSTIEIRDDATLKDLIERLVNENGPKLKEKIIDPTTNEVRCTVIVSGRWVHYSKHSLTKLKDDDVVHILPFFAGG